MMEMNMKRGLSIVAILAVVIAAATVAAQSKPSFAGKWTLVPDPNAPTAGGRGGRGMGGGLGQEFTAAQDEKTLAVTTNNPQIGEIKAVYNLDGTETKNPLTFNGNTIERVSKAKWDGAKLVITTTTNFGGAPTTTKVTYKKN
jgi:hypothetical protein